MFSKIVLCAFPNSLTAGLWRFGRLVSSEEFHNDDTGHENFQQFLRRHPNAPIHLIVDAVEEDYRLENLPHTVGAARRGLVERRLGQLYRNATYRAASQVGREKDKRRDDIYLFQALNNADSISSWIHIIEQLHAPLAGVYLLPMVSQMLVNRLKLTEPHIMLTDWQGTGLRQTYFQQGRLRVSRLAPSVSLEQGRLAELYESETEKTRLYLLSQRLIARDTRLNLLVLAPKGQGEEVCRLVGPDPGIVCTALDTFELAKRLGLDQEQLQRFPELLYMQVAAMGGGMVNLAPPELTHNYLMQQVAKALWLASAGVLAGGLLVFAINLFNTLDYRGQTEAAQAQTHVQENLYNDVARNFPVTPLSGGELKIAVEMAAGIESNTRTPGRFMRVVATGLDASPEIQLQRLRWLLTTNLDSTDGQASTKTPAAPHQMPIGGVLRELGFIDGEIRNFQGDYRAALDSVNHLATLIRKDPRVEQVQVVQQPVNVSSQSNLQGSTLDAAAQQMPAAQFKLKIVLKPEPASS